MKKSHFSILIVLLITLMACSSDPMEKLTPPAALKGAITPIKVLDYEKQTGKSAEGGQYIQAEILVPFNIKQEQVKPTILAALKEMKKENPSCHWFVAYLNPAPFKSSRLGIMLSAGKGEYKEGEITISYQIPTQSEALTPLTEKEFKAAVSVCVKYDPYYKESHDPNLAYQKTAADFGIPEAQARDLRERLLNYYGISRSTETLK